MKKNYSKKILSSLVSISTLFIMSCSTANEEIITNSSPINNIVKTNNYSDPQVFTSLSNELKKQNISLKNDEIDQVKKLISVEATGEWTPGPENDSKQNLEKHFLKHKNDFKPPFTSQVDYLSSAIKASKSNCDECNFYFDTKYYKDEDMISVIKWNSKTKELVVTRDNGQIATYFTDKTIKSPRFILINKINKK